MSFNSSFYRESSASASALLHVSTEVGESNAEIAQKSKQKQAAGYSLLYYGSYSG